MKKHMLTTLVSICMLLSGCGGKGAAPQPAEEGKPTQGKGGVFRLNMKSEPPSLNPAQATDQTSLAVLKSVMEGLTRMAPGGKPQNAAAADIKVSDDRKTYTFKLRDQKWSNGDPVTAQDFEYAWKWVLNPKNESQYAYQLYPLLNAEKAKKGEVPPDQIGVKALDDKTLEVKLANPTPYFLELTAYPTYFPVDKKVVEKNAKWHTDAATFVGNGPFKPTKWEHSSQLILEKNHDYWDSKAVKLNRIEMAIIEDTNTELSRFKNGELDWAGSPLSEIPTETMPDLKKSGHLSTIPIAGTYIYKFNTQKSPFTNAKIRKAFAYAIDRKILAENVMQGGQLPATAYVPPTMFKENAKGYFPDANYDEAKKLLAEGMKELGISTLPPIEISYNTGEAHAKIAQAIQDMWKTQLGANITHVNTEWKMHLDKINKGDFQIARTSWLGDYNDPINFLETYTIPQGNNNTFWMSDKYNQLIKASYTETDPAKREQILSDAEKILMDEMPIIPIYFYTMSYVKSDKIKDVYIDGLGNIDFKWAHMD